MRCLVLCVFVLLAACGGPVPRAGGDILALGDSVMAWNGTNAIARVMGRALQRDVVTGAVSGAQFDNDNAVASALGFDIRQQYSGGTWNWIVINGGANDLAQDCGCGACGAVVDGLISPQGTKGAIPEFLTRLHRESGARIVWLGYYAGNGRGSFEGCRDDLVEMEARIARLAIGRPEVFFVDAEEVFDPRDSSNFDRDNVHPSPKASALIGGLVARRIATQR